MENYRNLNKMLFNARRVINEKEREIEMLKSQLKTSTSLLSNNSIISSQLIT